MMNGEMGALVSDNRDEVETIDAAKAPKRVSEDGRTFFILLAKRAMVEAKVAKIQKRAARKGLTPVAVTWGKAYRPANTLRDGTVEYSDARIPMTIDGDAPKFGGWRFIAALQHLEGENIVRSLPGETIDESYRSRGSACDHCKVSRRRSDTYLLAHDDGRVFQVGSTCIDDFLGSADATKLAMAALYWAELAGAGDDDEGYGGSGSTDRALEEFLPYVAWCVREHGWVSRTAAREGGGTATADDAFWYTWDEKARKDAKVEISKADLAEATGAIAWAEAITDEDISKERGDFLHNLRAVVRTGLVTQRTAGIAGAVIIAFQRAQGRERERAQRAERPVLNEYLGTIGKRETWTNVTLDFVTGYETSYGYTTILKFRTDEGATLVWKASGDPKAFVPVSAAGKGQHHPWDVFTAKNKKTGVETYTAQVEITRADVGKRYAVKGTVKKHDEYKGQKQTILSRCVVDALPEAS